MTKEVKMTEIDKMEYEYYKSHREYLLNHKHNMENKYSQHLIYLSAGVFTFISGIDKFIGVKEFSYKIILLYSLGLSLFSLISMLMSFFFSVKAFKTELEYWDKERKNHPSNCNTKIMIFFTNIGSLSLIVSIILLFIFYFNNY